MESVRSEMQKLAVQMGVEILRADREWFRESVETLRASGLVTEQMVTPLWAITARELATKPPTELASMLAAALVESVMPGGNTPAPGESNSSRETSRSDDRPGQYL